jgi:hypothetical protein
MLSCTKNEKSYWFIIIFISVELLVNFLFSFSNIGGFSLAPYTRIILILFTGVFFIFDISMLKVPKRVSLNKIHLSNIFVYGWFLFSFVGVFISVINKNSVLYTITDFLYVFFGALLFYVSERNLFPQKTNKYFFIKFSRILVALSLLCFLFEFKPPALLMVLTTVLLYINLTNRRALDFIILLIPYVTLVVSTNRAQLAVLLLMFFILFLRKTRVFLSKSLVLFMGIAAATFLYTFRLEIIDSVLPFFDRTSNIGWRIYQLSAILRDDVDYSSPYFVSILQRFVEAEVVIQYWTQSIFTFLFGMGPGATIDGTTFFIDDSVLNSALLGSNQIHNIHLLPVAFIFRYGMVGLFFFGVLCLVLYNSFIKLLNEKEDDRTLFWNLFLVCWFFFSIPASSFLWSMPVFWISLSMIKKE